MFQCRFFAKNSRVEQAVRVKKLLIIWLLIPLVLTGLGLWYRTNQAEKYLTLASKANLLPEEDFAREGGGETVEAG